MEREKQVHPFPPVWDGNSKTLILGSFPSVASREAMFYYGHRRNRFWKVIAAVFGEPEPETVEEKRRLVLKHNIALWDSIASCTIVGSADSGIRDAVPNRIWELMEKAPIERVFCNGKTSFACYEKYVFPKTGVHAAALPSTSPANAAKGLGELTEAWKVIKEQ